MINLNKSLHSNDYLNNAIADYMGVFRHVLNNVPGRVQHQHRRWEHCMALTAMERYRIDYVLEVGSGGSYFAPMAVHEDYNVTVIDPDDTVNMAHNQSDKILVLQQDFMTYETDIHYDAVVCLSVLEHVDDDFDFFEKICNTAETMIFLTVDFSMDGSRFSKDHLRTYSPDRLWELTEIGEMYNFELTDEPEWINNGQRVYRYNFASLCMVKQNEVPVESILDLSGQYALS
jgi:hypothetical protein